jgi:hypothetical protein
MRSIVLTAALVFASGAWSAAQEDAPPDLSLPESKNAEEKRPSFAVPEPIKSRADLEYFTVTSVVYDQNQENIDRQSTALPELGDFYRRHIKIDTKVRLAEGQLGDKKVGQSDMLFFTGSIAALHTSDYEKKFLGAYLRDGGFLFAEDIQSGNGRRGGGNGGVAGTPFDRQLKALLADPLVLGSAGKHWKTVSNDHAIYKSYFDFPSGPPLARVQGGNISYLEVLEIRGRTAVIFSDLCISRGWGDLLASSRERDLQFGANLIVFAIAQRAAGIPMIKNQLKSQ